MYFFCCRKCIAEKPTISRVHPLPLSLLHVTSFSSDLGVESRLLKNVCSCRININSLFYFYSFVCSFWGRLKKIIITDVIPTYIYINICFTITNILPKQGYWSSEYIQCTHSSFQRRRKRNEKKWFEIKTPFPCTWFILNVSFEERKGQCSIHDTRKPPPSVVYFLLQQIESNQNFRSKHHKDIHIHPLNTQTTSSFIEHSPQPETTSSNFPDLNLSAVP